MNPPSPTDTPAFAIKSASFDAVRIAIGSCDLAALRAALDAKFKEAGAFFEEEPVVVDASMVDGVLDWTAAFALLREFGMKPIGAVAASGNAEAATQAGIALLQLRSIAPRRGSRPPSASAAAAPAPVAQATPTPAPASSASQPPAAAAKPAAPPAEAAPPEASEAGPVQASFANERTMVLNRPLRSGQRVYARGADLIVMGFVSRGAEVIADGNVHVYGPLRGRAIAGASGDAGARIFSTHLDAELVAIAGIYRTTESPLPDTVQGQPGVVRLVGERLLIEPLVHD